ncbi:hypothetical protein E8E14_003220 [Neopestalotiopsis sp. 37M]|nr:hypothetical protein E8E14_003220 [Neopestalotiopsis sp. 37M]
MDHRDDDLAPPNRVQANVDIEINQEDCESVIIQAEETRRKTSIDLLQSPVSSHLPWRAPSPSFQLYGPDGLPKAINDIDALGNNGHLSRRFRKTPGSDGVSSVTCIYDLGLDMAPGPPKDSFTALGLDKVADTEIEEAIRKIIDNELKTSKMDNQEYLPLDVFEAIFSSQAVRLLIKSARPKLTGTQELEERVNHIMGADRSQCLRRILAILVMVRRISYIEKFIEEDIQDSDLPIQRSHDGLKTFTIGENVTTKVFEEWDRNDVELFFIYQKMMFVPFFDIREDQLCYYEFGLEIRLPWQDCEAKTSGGSGLFHKVQIHPSHLSFRCPDMSDGSSSGHESILGKEVIRKPVYFALKEIFATDREVYKQELRALEKSFGQKQRESHLIKLLLTFKHGEKYYLLFEWADGNLDEFWEQNQKTDIMSDAWFIKQCLGIASALKRIHGLTTWQVNEREEMLAAGTAIKDNRQWGRHGDIKPHNILWFDSYENDPHHLVISDLGLTQFHSQLTRSDVPISRIQGCTQAYRAPEMDLGYKISQKYDIWSLGCVFLEFCLWYIFQISEVREFEGKRENEDVSDVPHFKEDKFFNIIVESAERRSHLKPCVTESIEAIRTPERSTDTIKQVVDLIEEKMLQTDPEKRDNIKMICRKLKKIQESTPEGSQPLELKAHADTPVSSSAASFTTVEEEAAHHSVELEVAQKDLRYHSTSHAQGGSDSVVMDTTDISTRPRAISIGSQSAKSEGEFSVANRQTKSALTDDQPVNALELNQDNADARPARREATPKSPDIPRKFTHHQATTNYTSRETQTEVTMLSEAAHDSSSSMIPAEETDFVAQQLHLAKSQVVLATTLDRAIAREVMNERTHGRSFTSKHTAKRLWRETVHIIKRSTSLHWWGDVLNRRTRSVPAGKVGVRRNHS